MTEQEKDDLRGKYVDAAMNAIAQWKINNKVAPGHTEIFEVEAHPETIDRLQECYSRIPYSQKER